MLVMKNPTPLFSENIYELIYYRIISLIIVIGLPFKLIILLKLHILKILLLCKTKLLAIFTPFLIENLSSSNCCIPTV